MTADGVMDAATYEELQRLARSSPRSGREAQAKASAIRTLERMSRQGRTLLPSCPPDCYPPDQIDWDRLTVPTRNRTGGAAADVGGTAQQLAQARPAAVSASVATVTDGVMALPPVPHGRSARASG
jgi:hypothetical protein